MNLNGDLLTKILIAEYAVIAGVYAYAKDWPRLIYWLGATILTVGILRMK